MKMRLNALSRKISIRNQIFFLILIFLIVPFLFSFYYLDKPLSQAIKSKIGNAAQEALSLAGRNIEFATEDIFTASYEISNNPDIIHLLQDPNAFTPYEKYQIMIYELNKVSRSNYTTYAAVMDYSGNMITSRYTEPRMYNEIMHSDWLFKLQQSPNQMLWVFRTTNYTYADKRPIVSLAKLILEPQTNRKLGVLLYSSAEEDLYSNLTGLEGEVYLIDSDGTIISSADKNKLGFPLPSQYAVMGQTDAPRGQATVGEGKDKKLVNYYKLNQTGWSIVQVVDYDKVFKEIFDIRKANMILATISIALFILLTMGISSSISKPLILLVKKMTGIEAKQFNSLIAVNGPKEISVLQMTYNQMLGQLKDLLQRLKEEYKQKEDMRFRALQAQINPHFLLNTLNNIKWTAFLRGDREVGQMLSSLAGLMEGSTVRGGSVNTLKDEIDYIQNYIALMKLRYNEKLKIEFDVEDAILHTETVKFMLQPIIENCIEHGLEQLPGKGIIRVEGKAVPGMLMLTVSDNGIGMDADRLAKVRGWLNEASSMEMERIGIQNVHNRIRLQYGESFGLTIDSKQDAGTVVTYRLPLLRGKENKTDAH